jgi:hypothetical protein
MKLTHITLLLLSLTPLASQAQSMNAPALSNQGVAQVSAAPLMGSSVFMWGRHRPKRGGYGRDSDKGKPKPKPVHGDEMTTRIAALAGTSALSGYMLLSWLRRKRTGLQTHK